MILWALLIVAVGAESRRRIHDPGIFEFSSPLYELHIAEKWTVNATAKTDGPERVGVYLPSGYATAKFRIVKGDEEKRFQTTSRKVGDFVFLGITLRPDQILNRELQDEYELHLKATAKRRNEATLESQTIIRIRVLDDNDLFPFFRQSEYSATIDQRFPTNGRILQLDAVDADIGLNGEMAFALNQPSEYFHVESRSGWIRSFRPLDVGTYILQCSVEDRASRLFLSKDSSLPYFRNQINATILVTPMESRPPKLSAQPFPLRFYQNSPQRAALLSVADADRVSVELSEDIRSRGDVLLERLSTHRFALWIARVGDSAPLPISLIVRDLSLPNGTFVAENIPLTMNSEERRIWFDGASEEETPGIRLRVNESAPVDYFLHSFRVRSTFPEDLSLVRYRIQGKESSKLPFVLDRNSGMLRVRIPLISPKTLEFSVVAKLEGIEEKAFVDVVVEILDSNNHCPHFTNLPSQFRIALKSRRNGTNIFRLKAEDSDLAENGKISFKLLNSSASQFSVDSLTGDIRLNGNLSEKENLWTLKVAAIDSGSPMAQISVAELKIVTANGSRTATGRTYDSCGQRNLHSPKISERFEFEIFENAELDSTVGMVSATDGDDGYNGLVVFTVVDPYFGVDLYSGRLFVRNSLLGLLEEKKTEKLYELNITAYDSALTNPRSAVGKVVIRIIDVNDREPKFEKFSYSVRIAENTVPSDELIRLKALDGDSGQNGRVEYRIVAETDLFTIDPDSGALRLEKPLDRELNPQIRLLVLAVDRGEPPKFGFANVTIDVEDQNDNPPVCSRKVHKAAISEDIPSGRLVLCLGVSDADLGINAELRFKMKETVPFRIDQRTGCIFTEMEKPMDFETKNLYSFGVSVWDLGSPSLSAECSVEIRLVDVEENQWPPQFSDFVYESEIRENQPPHTEILKVKATDPEETNIRYELVDGNGLGFLEVDSQTGIIRTSATIDYERTPELWVTVRATDGDPIRPLSSHSHIYVRVDNVNDRRPVFSAPIYFPEVAENSDADILILRLNATDDDGPIRYSIQHGNPQSNFVLNEETGQLLTGRRHLDREAQKEHEIWVKACDSGEPSLCSSVMVVVTVTDKNDCPPKFKEASFNLTVPANRSGFLSRVFADDSDEDGPNADLRYSLEDSLDSRISIDDFGRISTSEPLAPGAVVLLTVVAEDRGEPPLRTDVPVSLIAVGTASKSAKSNRPPIFQSPEKWRHLYASDHDSVGTVLGRIEVEDADGDPLWFSIASNSVNPNETFAFNTASGELVLARRANLIDPKLRKVEIEIVVSDGFAEIRDKVFVHVTRSTASRPRFEQNELNVELNGEEPIGFVLFGSKAEFDDSATGLSHPHRLQYSIHYVEDVLASDSLRMDPTSGSLTVEKPLDDGVSQNFSVIISVKVTGGLENFAAIRIHRRTPNRHSPTFVFGNYEFEMMGNESVGSLIGNVWAFDVDLGLNGEVRYSIATTTDEWAFNVDSESGDIRMGNSTTIAEETVLVIRATDQSLSAPRSSSANIRILRHRRSLLPEPIFTEVPNIVVVNSESGVSSELGILNADAEGPVVFSVGDGCDSIGVDFSSGVLRLRKFEEGISNCSIVATNTDTNVQSTVWISLRGTTKEEKAVRFEKEEIRALSREISPIGSPVFVDKNFTKPLILNVRDFRSVRFRSLSPSESLFSVDSTTGMIRTRELVDYQKFKFWDLFVSAFDSESAIPIASNPLKVHIQIVDWNNNAPIFDSISELRLQLPTGRGTKIGKISATDPDGDSVRYSLKSSPLLRNSPIFEIDSVSGEIRIQSNDSTAIPEKEFEMEVVATDGVHSTISKVSIRSTKQRDDKTLRLPKAEYVISALENRTLPNRLPLLSIDWPLNAKPTETFRYELLTQTNGEIFTDSTSGLLYLNSSQPLDREMESRLDLVVLVRSEFDFGRFAQTIVRLHIEDVNDCAPMFLHIPYEVTLSENAKAGDRLMSARARDSDSASNGIVRYDLDSDAPDFLEMNRNDGRLLMKRNPKAGELVIGAQYQFHIKATDQGNPPLESKEMVTIRIVDQNQPVFGHNRYTTRISESSAPGTSIFRLHAQSNTEGQLAYRIIDGDPLNQFTIGFRDGLISVNSLLDRETQSAYNLTVEAIDLSRSNISAQTKVFIEVDDVNDTAPKFEKDLFEFVLGENSPSGTAIGSVRAIDPDLLPTPNLLTYQLANGKKSIISMDSQTGNLFLSGALDFEAERIMEWTVTATDADGLVGEAVLRLIVRDENDSPPQFLEKSPLVLEVEADHSAKQFIHRFNVFDADTVNSLSVSDDFVFSIDNDDLLEVDSLGVLRRRRPLDSSELQKLAAGNNIRQNLNVSVSDGLFGSQLSVSVIIRPLASDVLPLRFGSPIQSIHLNKNRLLINRTTIETLKPKGGRRPLRFSTPPTNSSWPLSVNAETGQIFLSRSLTSESPNSFIVPFAVHDVDGRSAFVRTDVSVQMENDNSPEMITFNGEYELSISITLGEEDTIAKIFAFDGDESDELEYTFVDDGGSVLSPNKYFSLNPKDGIITAKAPIPAELVGRESQLSVRVIDQNNPPHQQTVPFRLHITDGPVPQLSRFHFFFAVPENSPIGHSIGQITPATDQRDLQFEIGSQQYFTAERSTGRILIAKTLDRETKSSHHFVVRVKGFQGAVGFAIVTVTVVDVNDNAPQFQTLIDRVYVREDSAPGSVASVFVATDADSGANGRVIYEVRGSEDFRVDREFGWLFVGPQGLDREKTPTYRLAVIARDEAGLSTELKFEVVVRDVNDSPPEFEKPEYRLELNDSNVQIGEKLLHLNVKDADTSEVQNLTLGIAGRSHSNILRLKGNDVILNEIPEVPFDSVEFTLIAFDGIFSAESLLRVSWKSSNRSLCAEETATISIPSNHSLDLPIWEFGNAESNGMLIHHLIGAEHFPFEIVNNSQLMAKSDFYKNPKVKFFVKNPTFQYPLGIRSVQSRGKSEYSCIRHLNIIITPSNRMSPKFQTPNYTIHIGENTNVTTDRMFFVLRAEAKDEDLAEFGKLEYSIVDNSSDPNVAEYFQIHKPTGAILLKKPLDREIHESFRIGVLVTDGGGLSDFVNVSVIVDDVNDNAPQFEKQIYEINVLENEAIGYVLLKFEASDGDVGKQKLRFGLSDPKAMEFVELDENSGILRLIKSFDYEKIQNLTFEISVRDNGEPPLETRSRVNLEILDVNDNSPRFQQTLYESSIKENSKIGTKILKVLAVDSDSEHFGKVSYSLSGEDAEYLLITDDGWIELAKEVKFEEKKLIRTKVRAMDGGTPPLSDESLLTITVDDVNNHPPMFAECQMNAVIQEGVAAGQTLLTVSLSDADSASNGPPFRLEILGTGASAFTFDPLLNLITTRQLSFAEQKIFDLNVTAFDVGGLHSTCPLTVHVKPQSRHPPKISSQIITLHSLFGEFLGGNVGKIWASDEDPADLLRFSVVDSVNLSPSSLSLDHSKLSSNILHIDPSTGNMSASADLLPGLHRFNVSVTDGKFVVHSPVVLDVADIDQEALDHSISVHLNGIRAEEFVSDFLQKFVSICARILSVPTTHVRILSVQNIQNRKRRATDPNAEMELLLTVSRGEARGYHRPSFLKQKMAEGIARLTAETGLEITALTSEVCRSDTCSKGECRDRLWLDNTDLFRIADKNGSNYFVFPHFVRTFECLCPQGFSGRNCDVAMNKCSREMCSKYELCVPNDHEPMGFSCVCPPGFRGDRCSQSSCELSASQCSQKESISVLGDGFFQMMISQNVESRMELSIEFKTVSRNGVLFYGSGFKDFHSLRISDSKLLYEWDCGSGVGRAEIHNVRVDDGQWHIAKIIRRGRQVRLNLDSDHHVESASPIGSDVINLFGQSTILTFGALVSRTMGKTLEDYSLSSRQHHNGRQSAAELSYKIENGTVGCIGRIGLDGVDLPKTENGIRLQNAHIGCNADSMGPCLSAPCSNGGQCVPREDSFSCVCSERFTGANCEIDLNACASSPCPNGISCHNLYNDFHCSCPPGFTGKTCQMRGDWDPCVTSPCGPFGSCVRYKSTFICNCSDGFGGSFCSERVPKMLPDGVGSVEFLGVIAFVVFCFLSALLLIYICRRRNTVGAAKSQQSSRAESERLPGDDPTNPLVPPTPRMAPPIYQNTVERPPPPLPPKNVSRRSHQSPSGLPTVEVRPMVSIQRSLNSPSSSDFHKESTSHLYDETYEEPPKPKPPPHRNLNQNEEKSSLLAKGIRVSIRKTDPGSSSPTKYKTAPVQKTPKPPPSASVAPNSAAVISEDLQED